MNYLKKLSNKPNPINQDELLQSRTIINCSKVPVIISQDNRYTKYVLTQNKKPIQEKTLAYKESMFLDHGYYIRQSIDNSSPNTIRECFDMNDLINTKRILK